MNWPSHGSNPHYIYEAMKIPKPDHIIDLSANINPLGPPPFIREAWEAYYQLIEDYPDPHVNALRETIALKEELPKEMVLIGNGGAEIITLLGRLFSDKHVRIIQPAFSEYEQTCRANDCQVSYHYLDANWDFDEQSIDLKGIAAVFLCSPNNPTGVCFPFQKILHLAKRCRESDTYLVIDEAFHDFWQDYQSLVPIVRDFENVILLRSLTKMFAIPGLRLGYALAHQEIIQRLAKFQPHWSVNSVAMHVGEACIKEKRFLDQTIDYIQKEREKLFSFYGENGFVVSPSKTNFYLLRDPQQSSQLPLFEYLLRHGIVPRHTMNFPGLEGQWLRFAIKSAAENNRLIEVLKDWRK